MKKLDKNGNHIDDINHRRYNFADDDIIVYICDNDGERRDTVKDLMDTVGEEDHDRPRRDLSDANEMLDYMMTGLGWYVIAVVAKND